MTTCRRSMEGLIGQKVSPNGTEGRLAVFSGGSRGVEDLAIDAIV